MARVWRGLAPCLLGAVLLLCGACDRQAETPGVVATINGHPVTIGQLEFNHDLRGLGLVVAENPTVESLRQDYGRIMADLIVRELMREALAKAGQPVTDEDVAGLERRIRADYPPEVFDRLLFEENIDLDRWRESLTTRATLDKFVEVVLKDRLTVSVQEAADYYKAHVEEFRRPERVRFLVVRGPTKKLVEEALKQRESGRTFPREPGPEQASIQEAKLPLEAVPEAWRATLAKLKPGQASPVAERDGEAQALVLLEKTPAHTLDPAAAFPFVEKALLERKRNAAFAEWLAGAAAVADIRISAHLLRPDAAISEAPAPDILKREFPGVGEMDGELTSHLADTDQVSKSLATRLDQAPEPGAEGPAATDAATPDDATGRNRRDVAALDSGDIPEMLKVVPDREPEEPAATDRPSPAEATPPTPDGPAGAPAAAVTPPAEPGKAAPETAGTAPSSPPPAEAATGPGEVEFLANKASWIIYKVDDGKEERVYLKNGKTQTIPFKRKLSVRFGSPSDVSYRFQGREERVESSAREVKSLDFP